MSTRIGRVTAFSGVVLLGLGIVTAPGTATVAAKRPPGKTLVITVNGLGPQATARVRVTGPRNYAKTVRVNGRVRLIDVRPGRYKIVAKLPRAARLVKRVHVGKKRGARVRFRSPRPAAAPGPVRDLRVVERTVTSIELAWRNPPPSQFLEVQVFRSGGTENDPTDFQISDSGDRLLDTGLTAGATYTYTLTTLDEAGRTSAARSITVTTLLP